MGYTHHKYYNKQGVVRPIFLSKGPVIMELQKATVLQPALVKSLREIRRVTLLENSLQEWEREIEVPGLPAEARAEGASYVDHCPSLRACRIESFPGHGVD